MGIWADGALMARLGVDVGDSIAVGEAAMRIDAVLMYSQRGHGKRSGFYSDYTFGVWDGEILVPVGRAYFGFTDAELTEIDRFVRDFLRAMSGIRDRRRTVFVYFALSNIATFLEALADGDYLEANGKTVLENATILPFEGQRDVHRFRGRFEFVPHLELVEELLGDNLAGLVGETIRG